ncbi:MAG: hypothetical protein NTV94_18045, partial [Planctomycetota bacterium]|nr:hypothetical protein [Planctomycetota bacterium]
FRLSGSSESEYSESTQHSEEHAEWLRCMSLLERGPRSQRFDQLQRMGIDMPAPESLSDRKLPYTLWGIIYALAAVDAYLDYTDHLTDRELYEELWHRTLRNESTILPPGSGWACRLGLLDGGSDEENDLLLKFYWDDEERERWASEFPDYSVPPREAKRACRDKFLPNSPSDLPRWSGESDDLFGVD